MDIYDIPIAEITRQYVEFIDKMRELNLDIAGDYIVMAATLTYIKSRMLLPRDTVNEIFDDEGHDPRAELVHRLLEYQRYKEVADKLKGRPVLGRDVFSSSVQVEKRLAEEGGIREGLVEIELFDLAVAFNNILDSKKDAIVEFHADQVSIMDAINSIVDRLQAQQEMVEIFSEGMSLQEVIATFLAVLELVRLKLIRVFQHTLNEKVFIEAKGVIGDLHEMHIDQFDPTPKQELIQ